MTQPQGYAPGWNATTSSDEGIQTQCIWRRSHAQTLSLCNQGNKEMVFWFSSGIWVRTRAALPIHRQPEKSGEQWGSTVWRWHHGIQGSENKGLQKDMKRLSEWAIKHQIKFNVAKCEVMFMAEKMFGTSCIRLWAPGLLSSKIFGL